MTDGVWNVRLVWQQAVASGFNSVLQWFMWPTWFSSPVWGVSMWLAGMGLCDSSHQGLCAAWSWVTFWHSWFYLRFDWLIVAAGQLQTSSHHQCMGVQIYIPHNGCWRRIGVPSNRPLVRVSLCFGLWPLRGRLHIFLYGSTDAYRAFMSACFGLWPLRGMLTNLSFW